MNGKVIVKLMGENNKEEVPKLVGNKSTAEFPMYKGCVTVQVRLAFLILKFKENNISFLQF